jgi:membrane protein implicated in regulation of membrane protease activity
VAKTRGGPRRSAASNPSDEVLIARARVYLILAWALGTFVCLVGLGIFALMAVPLAHAIAGKHTDFGMTVSVSFNAALTATTALAGGGLLLQSRRVSRYKNRTRQLEQRLEQRGDTGSSGGGQERRE